VLSQGTDNDFICLTDIARYKNTEEPNVVVANWLRIRNTVEYLGIWEQLYNPNFKPLEFEGFRSAAGAINATQFRRLANPIKLRVLDEGIVYEK
jgi:hypothetical protein